MKITEQEAQEQFSEWMDRALDGDEVLIERDGRPVVRLVPLEPLPVIPRVAGALKGKIFIADDFDTLPEEFVRAFGSTPKPEEDK